MQSANLPDPALLCFSHPLLMEHLESCCVSRKSDDAAKSWLPVQGGAICVIWRAREGGKMKMRERSPVTKSAAHFLPTSTSQFFSKFSVQPHRSNYQPSRAARYLFKFFGLYPRGGVTLNPKVFDHTNWDFWIFSPKGGGFCPIQKDVIIKKN